MSETPDVSAVQQWLSDLHNQLTAALEDLDGKASFRRDRWQREQGGGGETRCLAGGELFEKAGINFSHVHGETLPPSATAQRPELAGKPFRAMGVSLVLHPYNPFVPTAHANVRFFVAGEDAGNPVWWFGGGFDLTPYYGFEEDAVHWHRVAQQACTPFGDDIYPRYKAWCDEYFFLRHRNETRGVGGLFFDDLNQPDFPVAFALTRSVGEHFLPAYVPIAERRRNIDYSAQHREFQLYRRGRYVEFNLVYDRGTLFGLQSGGRTESILMSLPPLARWEYDFTPTPGSDEARLYKNFLKPRDWLNI